MDELERALRAVLDDPAQLQELRTLAGSLGLGQPDAAAPQEAAVPPMPPPAPPPAQPPKPPVQETVSLPEPAAAMLRQAGKADKKQEALLLALKPFLRKDRQSKIDRALQATRLASLASLALKNRGRGPGRRRLRCQKLRGSLRRRVRRCLSGRMRAASCRGCCRAASTRAIC